MSEKEIAKTTPASRLQRRDGFTIAYHHTAGKAPGLMFLGGFMSDMTGTKASALEEYARSRGRACLRFDYFGHGQSTGDFEAGTIGRWTADSVAALDELTEGPQVLVGSSMGGWLMLLAALARPERVAGLVGIAAAPDFTEDLMWATFSPEVRRTIETEGVYRQPNDYGEQPYAITRQLIEEGRHHLVLRDGIPLTCPVRLLHGMADPDVPWQHSPRLAERLESDDVELHFVKAGDHRLSSPDDLELLESVLDRLFEKLDS